MRNWYRVRLGKNAANADACLAGGFVGVDYGLKVDLTGQVSDDQREFNERFIPVHQAACPGKSKVASGLACGAIWTLAKGIEVGDAVLSPVGGGRVRAGVVTGGYVYRPGEPLPHRRPVDWFATASDVDDLSPPLWAVVRLPISVLTLTPYAAELDQRFVGGPPILSSAAAPSDRPPASDPWAFALEKHLEEFLVHNWHLTELGQAFGIYEEDGEKVGQQYQTPAGPLDILAVSKDRQTLLVVELKKGRTSDVVVGQTLRYMGYVQEELAESGQRVHGAIVALGDDPKLMWALKMVPSIRLYRYQVDFRLVPG